MFRPLNNDPDSEITQGLAWCPSSRELGINLNNMKVTRNFMGLTYEKVSTENLNITKPTSFQKGPFVNIF